MPRPGEVSLGHNGVVLISIHATGDSNDTLVLSSDLFNDSASRAGVMRQLRVNWQDLLCKEGFKTVFLTEPGIFSGYHDFALRCPRTAQDRAALAERRANLAASLESDFTNGDQVFASGSDNEVLSMVISVA